jgi:transcriptional regulator with XRE-family HTH domain
MSGKVEIQRLKEILKALMQKKGYKYDDLARELHVSVTTVKRMMNKEELSLSRFFQILEWLGVSLSEISSLVGEGGRERFPELTDSQEQFLCDQSDHAVILEELMVGRSLESIQKKFKLTPASLQKYLLALDKENLIELMPNGQVRRLIKNMKVRRGGPFSHRIAERLGVIAKENVEQGLIFGNQTPKFSFHFNTNLWMSK